MRRAQVDKPNFHAQPLPTLVNSIAPIQRRETPGAGQLKTLIPQGLPHSGQLNLPVRRMKMFQPVGGQILLARPEQKGPQPRPAGVV